MDFWGQIVVYALGLILLQFPVYRHLINGGGPTVSEGSDQDSARTDRYTHPEVAASLDDDSQVGIQTTPMDRRICPNCRAENKANTTFDLCWSRTRRLR